MNLDNPEPTKVAIMEATYEALNKHGYSSLTIQDIADEFDRSKSLLYYHYESKETLLADFLEYTLQEFISEFEVGEEEPSIRLERLLDRLVPESVDTDSYPIQIALLELRAQAPHTEVYRERYSEVDTVLTETIEEILQQGIERGEFQDVDAESEAQLLVSMIYGTRVRRFTTDEFPVEQNREMLFTHVDRQLLV